MREQKLYPDQIVPIGLTVVVFLCVSFILYLEIRLLNLFVISREHIELVLRPQDILIGLTIYLKTSIDFAIYIGRLMSKFPGWKNRIMIEIGTAFGNAVGTFLILLMWDLFREVRFLMAIMITIASLVLFRLAESGLDHIKDDKGNYKFVLYNFVIVYEKILSKINRAVAPVLNKIIPNLSLHEDDVKKGFKALFILSFTVPFILGLDDFAGYIPLFSVINIYGFAIGVFFGHMLLNIFLFLSPRKTIELVKNPVISFIGSIVFVLLGIWGLIEVAKLIGFVAHV